MRLCLVEDLAVAGLEPLTLTRAAYRPPPRRRHGRRGDRAGLRDRPRPGPPRVGDPAAPGADPAAPRPAHGRQRRATGWPRGRRSSQLPAGSRPRASSAPRPGPPWLGLCEGRPAVAIVGPERAVALTPQHVDDWFDDLAAKVGGVEVGGHWLDRPWDLVDPQRRVRLARLPGPRRPERHEPPPPGDGPGRPGRPAPGPRVGADRPLHRLRHDQRPDRRRAAASGSSRSPGSRGRASSAATPSSSAPTSGAASRSARPAGSAARSRRRSSTATRTSTTRGSSATPTSASGSTSAPSPPTATSATTTARSRSPCRATRSRPARRRSAASSATTPGPASAAC